LSPANNTKDIFMRIPIRFLLILIILIPTVHAQDWTTWLYHPDDGLLVHLDSDGDILDTRSIPTDDGYDRPHTIVFSHDQSLMATVAKSDNSFRQRLTLYEVSDEAVVFVYDLPVPDDMVLNADDQLILSENAFSYDDTRLTFVTVTGGVGWTIHVADTSTGELTHTLSHDHPQIELQPYLSAGDIPQIATLQDDMIGFYVQNRAGNPAPMGHSYAWFLIADVVSETIAFPNANHDTLANGEAVYPLPNKQFPLDNETVPISRLQHNVVYVYQTGEQIRYPAIARPEMDLLRTWFIQGGERVLVEAHEDEIRTRWLVYDRNGTEMRNLPQAGYDVSATRDGFLYLTELNEKTILVHVDSRRFETAGDTVWVDEGNWQIVGVTGALGDDLLPFAQLDNAETPPPFSSDTSPTPFPTPLPLVYIGREMQIQVFDDGYINLRDDPSTEGDVQALLENGIYVDILEGPVDDGVYTWWKVGLSGREGWLVEEVDGTQILIPRRLVEIDEDELEIEEEE